MKRRIFRVRRSVREKRSVAEAMVHIISSTSTYETPFTRASIVEEQLNIVSELERLIRKKRSATHPITPNRITKTTRSSIKGAAVEGEAGPSTMVEEETKARGKIQVPMIE